MLLSLSQWLLVHFPEWGYLRVLPTGDSRIQPLSASGAGARQAEVLPEPQAIPTAMK